MLDGNVLEKIRDGGFSFPLLAGEYQELSKLKGVPQNPDYHAEGDVFCHTQMVCGKLVKLPDWQKLGREEQELLFLAAAFHDIGKISCTKQQDGKWVSPKHTVRGEKEFRRMAYREGARYGLSFRQREAVAKLIRYHGLPVWFWTKKRPDFNLLEAAECVPLRLLFLLSFADVQGREADLAGGLSGQVELFADYAKELDVWEHPYAFSGAYTKFRYFQKESLWQGTDLYDGLEFDVTVMSGLPLSGKDTWIGKNGGNLPVVSLDDIRAEMGIPPAKGSGRVVQEALGRARDFLRKKEPFIWNATNTVQETRQKLVRLFAGYGARVHLIYLEAPYGELLARNRKRERHIPEPVLEDMIRKLEIPAPWEAYEVKWVTE